MKTPNSSDLDKVLEKINEIAKESATGDYIYRGEPKHHDIVSSSLYREYRDIESEHFDIAVVQEDILREAREYTPHKMEDFELLATLQHHGDKTNLIDFTTDYLVALFFACDGETEKPGRVILLRRQSESGSETYKVKKPPRTIRRAEAQKSIFVQAPKGFVEPDRTVTIPAHLKAALLEYLRNHHDISTKTIYNDLQGFIEKRGLHKNTYTEFYKGVTSQGRADSAKTEAERQKCYNDAITHYTEAIDLNPELTEAYNNRGVAYRSAGIQWILKQRLKTSTRR
jgi:tetratricopeptide (TPR) repeat protein